MSEGRLQWVRVTRGGREEANHETRANEAAIRDGKLLGPFPDAQLAITSASATTALPFVPYRWNGHVRAIQLLLRIGKFWRRIVNWAISGNFINNLLAVCAAIGDGVGASIEIFVGGESKGMGRLVPAFAAGGVVVAGGTVHCEGCK